MSQAFGWKGSQLTSWNSTETIHKNNSLEYRLITKYLFQNETSQNLSLLLGIRDNRNHSDVLITIQSGTGNLSETVLTLTIQNGTFLLARGATIIGKFELPTGSDYWQKLGISLSNGQISLSQECTEVQRWPLARSTRSGKLVVRVTINPLMLKSIEVNLYWIFKYCKISWIVHSLPLHG